MSASTGIYEFSMAAFEGEVVTQGHANYCRDNGHTTDGDWCHRCGDVLFAREAAPAPAIETVRPRAAYQSLTTLAELVLDYACDNIATPASGDIAAKGMHFGIIARPAISLWGMRSAGGHGARA